MKQANGTTERSPKMSKIWYFIPMRMAAIALAPKIRLFDKSFAGFLFLLMVLPTNVKQERRAKTGGGLRNCEFYEHSLLNF
ncbi:MAG: hypothetical protein HC913_12800 [Microscillaceae bacterium]|nr:hypothetical protein [Microscillaceae bacterium]